MTSGENIPWAFELIVSQVFHLETKSERKKSFQQILTPFSSMCFGFVYHLEYHPIVCT